MAGVNKVILLGYVGKDPEIRSMQSGDKIANFSIATSESWTDKASGERKEKTEWHRIVVFNPHLVEVVERYVTKGKQVYLEGQLQTRKWTDQAGVEKYSTEIVLPRFGGTVVLLAGGEGGSDGERAARPAAAARSRSAPRSGGYSSGGSSDGARSKPGAEFGNGGQMPDSQFSDDDIPF